ncbi:MAG: hypothetical protein RR851_13195 [Clostridium sp.]
MSNNTKDWDLYEKGKKFCNTIEPNYFSTVETNLDFFAGNQWRNVKSNGMPTPVFNIIKRSLTFFVSSITSQKVKVNYETLESREDDADEGQYMDISKIATSEVANLFEKFKMDNRIRDALFDAGTMGDVAAHMYFDYNSKPYGGAFNDVQGEIQFELVDGTNVFFGNPNNPSTSTNVQPYIIISGRDSVENLKREAMENMKGNQTEVEGIETDKPSDDMAGQYGQVEIEGDKFGKATYIIIYKYDRESKTIKASKCTKSAYMFKDVDTGLSIYPISWLVWERQKNLYHGRALATGMIPNQIFINRMFAMVMYHLMMSAFPKAVYDRNRISSWNNEIGVAIPVDAMGGENIKNIAGYLEPGNMSGQIVQVIDLAIQHTKESLGINDAMLGNINPESASGKSIVATVQQSQMPLENQKANLFEFIEEIGKILLDMMGTYYGARPILMNTPDGRQVIDYDFAVLKNIFLNCKTDVGASSYWSEIASVETLDNLFNNGHLDIIDYLESMPDGYIPKKNELIGKIKEKMAMQPPIPVDAMPPMGAMPPKM